MHAPGEALRHFEDALALWDRVPDAAERAGMPRSEVLRAAAAAANDGFESARADRAAARGDRRRRRRRSASSWRGMHVRARRTTCATPTSTTRATTRCGGRSSCCPADAALERARLRDQSSKSLMLRGHFREAALEAHETAAEARRLGALDLEAGAANTEGISLGALGDVEEGARLLRRARDLALEIDSPAELSRAAANLSELLDLAGRTEEALAEVNASLAGHPRPPRALALRHLPRAAGRVPAAAARPHGGGGGGDARPRPRRRDHLDGHVLRRDAREPRPAARRGRRRARARSTSCAGPCRPTGTRSGSRCWRR